MIVNEFCNRFDYNITVVNEDRLLCVCNCCICVDLGLREIKKQKWEVRNCEIERFNYYVKKIILKNVDYYFRIWCW